MSPPERKIAVDAMGSDLGPEEVIAGIAIALERHNTLDGIVVVGNEEITQPLLEKAGLAQHPQVSSFHASEVIGMDEKPVQSLKQKKDASVVRAIELVKLGHCVAAVSCGNTGSLMACATLRLRPLPGVSKPALATVWPSSQSDSGFVLLDAGANPQCKPENLVHYAILGSAYARDALGIPRPRVGLLSIGTEEGKGNDLTNESHRQLRRLGDLIDYHGLVEGFDLFANKVDVVVTDGFTGNVTLKSCEGLWRVIKSILREEFTSTPARKLGALLLKGANRSVKMRLDPEKFGGAPLLGLGGTVLKAHGSANREAISHTIRMAGRVVRNDLNEHILKEIAVANEKVRTADTQSEQG